VLCLVLEFCLFINNTYLFWIMCLCVLLLHIEDDDCVLFSSVPLIFPEKKRKMVELLTGKFLVDKNGRRREASEVLKV
jgi:hypothetical protein